MISFIRTLNKKGPITDPWGTPDVMGCVEEHIILFYEKYKRFIDSLVIIYKIYF